MYEEERERRVKYVSENKSKMNRKKEGGIKTRKKIHKTNRKKVRKMRKKTPFRMHLAPLFAKLI